MCGKILKRKAFHDLHIRKYITVLMWEFSKVVFDPFLSLSCPYDSKKCDDRNTYTEQENNDPHLKMVRKHERNSHQECENIRKNLTEAFELNPTDSISSPLDNLWELSWVRARVKLEWQSEHIREEIHYRLIIITLCHTIGRNTDKESDSNNQHAKSSPREEDRYKFLESVFLFESNKSINNILIENWFDKRE